MKLDSPLFNGIRVKPEEDRRVREDAPLCDRPGCVHAGLHRAPKGRNREREYWHFCLDHVREYNQSYNYFAGMSDDAVLKYQKDAITGHRPTWKMGFNGDGGAERMFGAENGPADPFDMVREFGPTGPRRRAEQVKQEARTVRNAERKAFDTLGLDIDATAPEIKARFKELVKSHHPDANGGDRSLEDKLRDIIQAYNYLKSAKFC